jgi:4-aminobutyrate aminotransferase-like enzyme
MLDKDPYVCKRMAMQRRRRFRNFIVISLPLVITRAECDRLVDMLDRALSPLPPG